MFGTINDFTANRGGWAPRERIVEAPQALGLWPTVVVVK